MKVRNPALIGVLLLSLVGCASTQESRDRECFDIRSISSWSALSDKHLYVKAPGAANHYFLTLWHRCPGLKFAEALAFSNYSNRLCSNDLGEITFRDGNFPRNCKIDNIERVSSRDEAKELAAAAKNAKDDEPESE